jgi:hypothetical protein
MSFCAFCGLHLDDESALCPYHMLGDRVWSDENRAWCDFFHRGKELPYFPDPEAKRELLATATVSA